MFCKHTKHIVRMAIVLVETSGGECSPIVLIVLLFPPLLLGFYLMHIYQRAVYVLINIIA